MFLAALFIIANTESLESWYILEGFYVTVGSLVAQSCPTLYNPVDYSLSGSSVHEILQARILEWVAKPSSRGSSQPRDRTQVSHTAGRFFTS